jgi:hypothetical protein
VTSQFITHRDFSVCQSVQKELEKLFGLTDVLPINTFFEMLNKVLNELLESRNMGMDLRCDLAQLCKFRLQRGKEILCPKTNIFACVIADTNCAISFRRNCHIESCVLFNQSNLLFLRKQIVTRSKFFGLILSDTGVFL